ncbi:hypothetical protein ACFSQP_02215 [Bizionia sediminis]|uniref:Sensor of ECF-type sigma factor n=1 Tax=Bizionia sediminis TaxID=1737064 RepID=A0ABW5KNM1_9FLAO
MKHILLLLITFIFSTVAIAQHKDHHEKIKTLKVAYITENLNLSPAEAQGFWPIYNQFQDSYSTLRKAVSNYRKNIDVANISESEAKAIISKIADLYEERYAAYKQYMTDLQTVLPAKKVILLKKVEEDFKQKMFEEYKNRHGKTSK